MIDWSAIDTVMLDMDGTLLDLHFDNYFWRQHLPERYAEIHGQPFDSVRSRLEAQIAAEQGRLQWYCLEFWSKTLDLDIRALKQEIQHKIQVRPHVEEFLTRLRQAGKQAILVTNAHPQSMSLKFEVTSLDQWLDLIISSHEFDHPKEAQQFWHALAEREAFEPARTLFIDDTLRVLDSARDFGIGHLLAIHQPDSQISRRVDEYPAIEHFSEIMPPVA
ncbi:GMP/IMP nucleotidase [Gilvimarinus sp. SDUM040013]|uniref:GMP/IMP nucleotidase n=1 Tax=Gilvimarinus gilvus TaxID=3058038 RepID=A0ABU4RXC2_9GAMM|nr:GMP/IMP nucleotidase [Gilvimarinus sp. SDUM040013]MDO3388644.1 GMP/IMP nucleotidase [Gilvimarinus sp. SDUM040013]MDX6849539.1 GMP/IMP nucleotidase [Gilvimarinus sp. SDUM040013]